MENSEIEKYCILCEDTRITESKYCPFCAMELIPLKDKKYFKEG